MRINRYISSSGVCSRRKADQLIANGNVKVNGLVLTEMGYDVVEGDVIEVNGRSVQPSQRKIYLMLNKPKGYITSLKDENDRPTVVDLLTDIEERVFPVGRLDADTTGLLVMTNDGDFSQSLSHPRNKVYKTYRAKVQGIVSKERLAILRKGVDIGGFVTAPAIVEIIKQTPRNTLVEIKIHEGKNRQVRKMFSAIGNKVIDLDRTAIGGLYLGNLMKGHYRKLTKQDVEKIYNHNY